MPEAEELPARRAGPDEQRRLRWLAEDLAACLAGLGAIAARLTQTGGLPGPTRVVVLTPWPETGWGASDSGLEERKGDSPIASVAWMWDDGLRVEYDWQAQVCRTIGPDEVTPGHHTT
jgi:hypothetical protein